MCRLQNIFAVREAGQIVAEVPYCPWRAVSPAGAPFCVGFISSTATKAGHRGCGHGLRCLRACLTQMEAG